MAIPTIDKCKYRASGVHNCGCQIVIASAPFWTRCQPRTHGALMEMSIVTIVKGDTETVTVRLSSEHLQGTRIDAYVLYRKATQSSTMM
jgi:hypothetical protein